MISPPTRLLAAFVGAGALCALGGSAQAASGDLSNCFSSQDVQQTVRVNAREINVRTRDGRYFRIITRGDCRSANVTDPLVFDTGRGSGLICRPVDVSLSSGVGVGRSACLVDSISRLSRGEVDALPRRARP